MPNTARSTTPGSVRILFIDASRDREGFEHTLSREVFAELREAGVDLATDDVIFADDVETYKNAFGRGEFNTLLLLTHGSKDPDDGNVSGIAGPGEISNYYELAGLAPLLRDKLICLAVCYGSCEDARQVFLSENHFALTLVAPKSPLSESEVRAFFPAFFSELKKSCANEIDPNVVRRCVDRNNHFANERMVVYSDALSLP
jgi:hypothetical protein